MRDLAAQEAGKVETERSDQIFPATRKEKVVPKHINQLVLGSCVIRTYCIMLTPRTTFARGDHEFELVGRRIQFAISSTDRTRAVERIQKSKSSCSKEGSGRSRSGRRKSGIAG